MSQEIERGRRTRSLGRNLKRGRISAFLCGGVLLCGCLVSNGGNSASLFVFEAELDDWGYRSYRDDFEAMVASIRIDPSTW